MKQYGKAKPDAAVNICPEANDRRLTTFQAGCSATQLLITLGRDDSQTKGGLDSCPSLEEKQG